VGPTGFQPWCGVQCQWLLPLDLSPKGSNYRTLNIQVKTQRLVQFWPCVTAADKFLQIFHQVKLTYIVPSLVTNMLVPCPMHDIFDPASFSCASWRLSVRCVPNVALGGLADPSRPSLALLLIEQLPQVWESSRLHACLVRNASSTALHAALHILYWPGTLPCLPFRLESITTAMNLCNQDRQQKHYCISKQNRS
jgi:hypothetical protein